MLTTVDCIGQSYLCWYRKVSLSGPAILINPSRKITLEVYTFKFTPRTCMLLYHQLYRNCEKKIPKMLHTRI